MTQPPSSFFAKPNERAVPVVPLAKGDFDNWKRRATTLERALSLAQGFAANEKELLIVPGKGGLVAKVILGLGTGGNLPDLLSLAGAKVPEGTYALEARLSKGEADRAALFWALGQYDFSRYRKNHAKGARRLRWPREASARRVLALAKAVFLARDLINTP
ncbi:MAG TPA: hypothetical protein VD713_00110, partial [Sphingomonadales bacterium]|nr:hypothetical protein [Sphingomonadales bacterium]